MKMITVKQVIHKYSTHDFKFSLHTQVLSKHSNQTPRTQLSPSTYT